MTQSDPAAESLEAEVRALLERASHEFSLIHETDAGPVRATTDQDVIACYMASLNVISDVAMRLAAEIERLHAALAEMRDAD